MILSTEPTAIARWILWILSNSLATSPSFCERTVADISMRRARIIAVCRPSAVLSRALSLATRGSDSVRMRTSRPKTVAAAGAPPMTEANDPSTAAVSMRSFSRFEKTTKAPPWYRVITTNTMGPRKLVTARPISAPYSSCQRRMDSGDPSKPDRFASTMSGRLPLAALMARANLRADCGNSVPEVHDEGPSEGTYPPRGRDWDSRPSRQTGTPPMCASHTTALSAFFHYPHPPLRPAAAAGAAPRHRRAVEGGLRLR